jgi:hypothetical protein
VDGVEVQEVPPLGPDGHQPLGDTHDVAAHKVGAARPDTLLVVARDHAPRAVSASWVAVVDREGGSTLIAGDDAPNHGWLAAFVHGAESAGALSGGTHVGGGDVIWCPVAGTDLALVAGRDRIAWRTRERRQLEALARILGTRWNEV